MTYWHHDFETYSEVDVRQVGASAYSRHPSTEVLMLAYAFDDGPVEQWVPAEGQPMPTAVRVALRDPDVRPVVWNRPFEASIWRHVLGIEIPIRRWIDAMVWAQSLSFPGKLEKAAEAMGLPDQHLKDTHGRTLISQFCKPRRPSKGNPDPRHYWHKNEERWEQFKLYNRRDVVSERAVFEKIRPYKWTKFEEEFYIIDQQINEAGIPVNLNMVDNAIHLVGEVISDRLKKMRKVTGLANPNSQPQLLKWLTDRGYPFQDLKKGHIERTIKTIESIGDLGVIEDEKTVHQVLVWKSEIARSSVKKFQALKRCTDTDGRLRFTLQMYGAGRTGRFSGKMFQPQNLPRPSKEFESPELQAEVAHDVEHMTFEAFIAKYPKPMDALATAIRGVLQAPKGYVLIVADLSAIENIVLGLMADEDRILRVFREKKDPYIDFGTYMFHQTYEAILAEVKSGKKGKRQIAKPPVLGAGYMLGPGKEFENKQTGEIEATGLLGYARAMGVEMTLEQSEYAVSVWRSTYKKVVRYWEKILDAAWNATLRHDKTYKAELVEFDYRKPFLRMRLPSGRHLHYYQPRIQECTMPWGDIRPALTYVGLDVRKQWTRMSTHPGKVVENGDQAIARDILAVGIRRARRRGIDVRMHVHDEIVALVPEDDAERQLAVLIEAMTEPPWWLPDAPLAAAGSIGRVYVKD